MFCQPSELEFTPSFLWGKSDLDLTENNKTLISQTADSKWQVRCPRSTPHPAATIVLGVTVSELHFENWQWRIKSLDHLPRGSWWLFVCCFHLFVTFCCLQCWESMVRPCTCYARTPSQSYIPTSLVFKGIWDRLWIKLPSTCLLLHSFFMMLVFLLID